jgi:hypothetical protein
LARYRRAVLRQSRRDRKRCDELLVCLEKSSCFDFGDSLEDKICNLGIKDAQQKPRILSIRSNNAIHANIVEVHFRIVVEAHP